jgi:hypothetical protein
MRISINVRVGISLWLAGMLGNVVLSTTLVPQMLAQLPVAVPVPVTMVVLISVLQAGATLALACWAGVALSRPLGLTAPAVEAACAGDGARAVAALGRQLAPALIAGAIVAALLVALTGIAPEPIRAASGRYEIPLLARILYGGITEELLMRWGLMTVLLWLGWRVLQRRQGRPRTALVVAAIVVSALAFAAGHLPTVVAMGVSLDAAVLVYVLVGNTIPGVLFGLLYWRYGIEAAIVAHMLGHALSALVI